MFKSPDPNRNASSPTPSSSSKPSTSSKATRSTADYSLSCAECRRLKLKCSRQQWPCETCVKRGIPHLCPDGVQKQKGKSQGSSLPSSKSYPTSSFGSNSVGVTSGRSSTMASTGESSALWSRLDGLERKLDLLIGASSGQIRENGNKRASPTNHLLHDLANIATDHYEMENGLASTSQGGNETARQQHGTLTVHPDGRAHYMGSNAHSMYLARENLHDGADSRRVSFREEYLSRPGSPTPIDLEAVAAVSQNARRGAEAAPGSPLEGNTPSTIESQPTQLVWATPGFRSPHSSTAIWNNLKSTLPMRDIAQRMVDVYYATVTFMFHPIPRSDFEKTIWSTFYSHSTNSTSAPPPNFHPHKLALLYSMLSLGVLLDVQRPQRDPVGRALYSCAWNALALSNFTEATSLEAILALMHINMYLTWRRGGRYAESAYPLLGTMMRMTISTGLHRDPSLFNLGEEERERRRRVFWDVQCSEVFRAFAFCRPPALCDRHVDTKFPSEWLISVPGQEGIVSTMPISSSRREGVFHAFKCKQVQITNRMLDECLCSKSSYQTTLRFDTMLRQMLPTMPAWMLPTLVDLEAKANEPIQDLERAYNDVPLRDEMILEMQRHTTLLNHYQALLLLHRGWFSQALQLEEGGYSGQNTPGTRSSSTTTTGVKNPQEEAKRLASSIQAVNESASNIVAITISAWCKYPSLVIRWAFFWNAIFSAAVCRGLFIVKSSLQTMESEKAWEDLKRAIQLLEMAVVGWKPLESPLGILTRLNKRAEIIMLRKQTNADERNKDDVEGGEKGQEVEGEVAGEVEVEGEDLELIGNDGGKKKRRKSQRGESSQKRLKEERNAAVLESQQPSMGVTVLDSNEGPTFDFSTQNDSNSSATNFIDLEQSSLYSTMLPSIYSNQSINPITMDFGASPNLTTSTSSTASASQLIQMLSSGLSWDDVSSWNELIVDL